MPHLFLNAIGIMPNQAVLEKFFGCNYFEFQQCLALREFGISSSVLSGSCGLVCGSRHGWPTLTSHKHSRWSKVELRTTWASFLASTLRKHCTLASFRTIQWLTKMIASEAKRDTHTHILFFICVLSEKRNQLSIPAACLCPRNLAWSGTAWPRNEPIVIFSALKDYSAWL